MDRRVVITGIGLYSSIGNGKKEVLDSLRKGKSGIVYDKAREEIGYRSCLTGMVEDPDLKPYLSRRERIGMHQPAMFAYMSTMEAMEQAKLDIDFLKKNETGIIYGNDSTAGAVINTIDKLRDRGDTTLIGSGDIFQNMNCTVNMSLSTIYKLKGINITLSAACASGSHSIGMGYLLIKQGLQERVVCGGAQEINVYSMASFDGLGAFSIGHDAPTKASKPFDANRDGLIPSGGAATLIIESLESAEKRGAPILGEILGYGFSSNGDHISNPNFDGQYRSLKMSLEQAGVSAKSIDVIPEFKEKKIDTFLSNSFGFGGTNSSLIVKKFVK